MEDYFNSHMSVRQRDTQLEGYFDGCLKKKWHEKLFRGCSRQTVTKDREWSSRGIDTVDGLLEILPFVSGERSKLAPDNAACPHAAAITEAQKRKS